MLNREKRNHRNSCMDEDKIRQLNQILQESSHIVFLGGAGVSTESGIPDFRSKGGLYRRKDHTFSKYRPEYLLSSECLHRKPELFFSYFRDHLDVRDALPNETHKKLAEMECLGKLDGIITQNLAGLHQKAGSRNVQEIHGSALRSYCVSCKKEYGADYIFENRESVPMCLSCRRMIRPDVTLYGELLPDEAYDQAIRLMQAADCLIIGGTSLEVGSAAGLAHSYHGKSLIIINKGKTKMEGKADLVFHDRIGEVMKQIDISG